ncbi:MAG: hypothetical protein GXO83_00355 [Chlorobi bacterium]|nr:hypothetical protein [Chlorobiota bacterium]
MDLSTNYLGLTIKSPVVAGSCSITSSIRNLKKIEESGAGADAVQVASVLYTQGIDHIKILLDGLKNWMEKHHFEKIDDFKGKMSQVNSPNPAEYERVQFMKYFSDKKYDLD